VRDFDGLASKLGLVRLLHNYSFLVVTGLVPVTPLRRVFAFLSEMAGTSPAMT
jgi:hypothetical protein